MGLNPIQFEMEAQVNGKEFVVTGEGEGDSSAGSCSLSLDFGSAPEGFDPISCPLVCHQQTSLSCAKSQDADADFLALTGGSYAVSPDRTGIIRNSDGEKLFQLDVRGTVEQEEGTIVSTQRMTGTSHLPPLERNVTPVQDYILPSGPGKATGITRYTLETKDGEMLDGVTVIPYKWDNEKSLSAPIVREVDIDTTWDGERWSDVDYRITMSSLEDSVKVNSTLARSETLPADD